MSYRTVGIALGLIFSISLIFQIYQVYRFINQGSRFTAMDGQELCERVRALEEVSYGYRDAGRVPLNCLYQDRK